MIYFEPCEFLSKGNIENTVFIFLVKFTLDNECKTNTNLMKSLFWMIMNVII